MPLSSSDNGRVSIFFRHCRQDRIGVGEPPWDRNERNGLTTPSPVKKLSAELFLRVASGQAIAIRAPTAVGRPDRMVATPSALRVGSPACSLGFDIGYDGSSQRMTASGFHRPYGAKQLVLAVTAQWDHIDNSRHAHRQCAGLIHRHSLQASWNLHEGSTLYKHAVLRCGGQAGDDAHRSGDHQRARTSNDQKHEGSVEPIRRISKTEDRRYQAERCGRSGQQFGPDAADARLTYWLERFSFACINAEPPSRREIAEDS